MELDFSILKSAEKPRNESSTDEVARSKRSLSPIPSSDRQALSSTAEDEKRLRANIDSALEEAGCSNDMRMPVYTFSDKLDRPHTPSDILNLRTLINAEFRDDFPAPVPVAMNMCPPPKEDPFKHAGLFRNYGGINGWLEMQRKDKDRRMCVVRETCVANLSAHTQPQSLHTKQHDRCSEE